MHYAALAESPIIFVGTKSDLKEQRLVTRDEAEAKAYHLLGDSALYIETSAKTGEGVTGMFE